MTDFHRRAGEILSAIVNCPCPGSGGPAVAVCGGPLAELALALESLGRRALCARPEEAVGLWRPGSASEYLLLELDPAPAPASLAIAAAADQIVLWLAAVPEGPFQAYRTARRLASHRRALWLATAGPGGAAARLDAACRRFLGLPAPHLGSTPQELAAGLVGREALARPPGLFQHRLRAAGWGR